MAATVELLGLHIEPLEAGALVDLLAGWASEEGHTRRAYYVNVHGANLAFADPGVRSSLNGADLLYCDGHGLRLGARLTGQSIPEALTIMNWIDDFLSRLAAEGRSVFLLGDEPGVAEACAAEAGRRHPELQVAGTHHGFFDPTGPEDDAVIEAVNNSGADVLLVGMGMPRQELWIDGRIDRLRPALVLTVGALYRWYAGVERRPPAWMHRHGLEWLGRLAQHPVRLFRRYVIGNPVFLARVVGRIAPQRPAPATVLYVAGVGRSGSTLLGRLLGQFPGYTPIGEAEFLWTKALVERELCGCGEPVGRCPFWSAVADQAFGGWERVDLDEMARLVQRVNRHRYLPLLLVPWLWPPFARRLARLTGLLDQLYPAIAAVSGGSVIVDASKESRYALVLRRVPSVDLKAVHLVRDPRGVAYSWTKRKRRPEVTDRVAYMARFSPLRTAWRWLVYNGIFELLKLGPLPAPVVRYEDLADAPDEWLLRIRTHAGEHPTDTGRPAETGETSDHSLAGNPMRFETGPPSIVRDEEWRSSLPGSWRVAVVAAPLMLRYGYLGRRR